MDDSTPTRSIRLPRARTCPEGEARTLVRQPLARALPANPRRLFLRAGRRIPRERAGIARGISRNRWPTPYLGISIERCLDILEFWIEIERRETKDQRRASGRAGEGRKEMHLPARRTCWLDDHRKPSYFFTFLRIIIIIDANNSRSTRAIHARVEKEREGRRKNFYDTIFL